LAVLTSGLLLPLASEAQQQPVRVAPGEGIDVKGVKVDTQKTPRWQVADVKDKSVKSPRDWLEIEVEFEPSKVDPRGGVIGELLFRFYVGIQGPDGVKVLTGDVTHINVVDGERDYHSAMYVSPSNLGKITGDFRRFQTTAVKGVGVEIFHNGVIVGGDSDTGSKFWEAAGYSPQPGIEPKHKTTFAPLWLDRYADVKKD